MDWVVMVAYIVGSYLIVAVATRYLWKNGLNEKPQAQDRGEQEGHHGTMPDERDQDGWVK